MSSLLADLETFADVLAEAQRLRVIPAGQATDPALTDLLAFTARTFPRYRPAPHHRLIAEHLEAVECGEIDRLIITMPPRHGKTQLASIQFPSWFLGRNPDKRVIGASYAALLAYRISRQARNLLQLESWPFDVALADDLANIQSWDIGHHRGGYLAAGVGGPIIGSGADLLIIDDPIKNQEEADSPTFRENVWEWYTSTAYTRLEDNGAVILVQCMTGETPVRMADNTERPLRDIRVGDRVATYDCGTLAASTVLNHVSQGYDNIYRITMTSGIIVHANERHPFLVEEHGQCRWMRLKDLTTAHRIVTVRDSGASGKAASAPLMGVTSPSVLGDSAPHTITSKSGQTGIDLRRSIRSQSASGTSSIAMASPLPSMTCSCPRRAASALSVSDRGVRVPRRTGASNSALTMITIPAQYVDSSATTVISRRDASGQPKSLMPSPRTSDFTTEQIASIEPAGVAEVFDLQIAHTENFIANGLVSHNTRWHADDLAGRLIAAQAQGGDQWTVLHLPAFADVGDPLGREPGAALWPEKYDNAALDRIKQAVGSRVFAALYQGQPSNDDTALLKREWWRYYRAMPTRFDEVLQSWDMTFKGGVANDYVVGQVWGKVGADCYLLDQVRGRLDFPATLDAVRALTAAWPQATTKLIEDTANGPAVIATLTREIGGIVAVRPEGGKIARVNAIAGLVEAHNVHLPDPALRSWAGEFVEEATAFPSGAHDDMVDAMSQALVRLMADTGQQFAFGATTPQAYRG